MCKKGTSENQLKYENKKKRKAKAKKIIAKGIKLRIKSITKKQVSARKVGERLTCGQRENSLSMAKKKNTRNLVDNVMVL